MAADRGIRLTTSAICRRSGRAGAGRTAAGCCAAAGEQRISAGLAGLFGGESPAARSIRLRAVDQIERNAPVGVYRSLQQVVGSLLVGDEVHRPQGGGAHLRDARAEVLPGDHYEPPARV